jgi:8-oxo-dGTP pyrophosphatase MutT (NUDIX family)/phosphohistidine phosphatase SixA
VASSQRSVAAGGLVWREDDGGAITIAVVHRPRYDDWSLPKGKADDGELPVRTAIREVGEETGADVAVTRRLGRVRYDVDGITKVVRYWEMRYLHGEFTAGSEVDEVRWLEPHKARRLLSYRGDRAILTAALAPGTKLPRSVLVLVRHAKAGRRADWPGSDLLRPLDGVGRAQAKALVALISAFAPVRIVAANPLRCIQTVEPLASALGIAVEVAPALSDESFARDAHAPVSSVSALIGTGQDAVVCSQGEAIPGIITALAATKVRKSATAKGAAWVLGCRDGAVVSADYYPATARV